MSQTERPQEADHPVDEDFDPNMSFRGPKELWAEWKTGAR